MGGSNFLHAVVVLLVTGVCNAGDYDPCGVRDSSARGDGFTIGLAFLPRSTIQQWEGLHPCRFSDHASLPNAQVSVFRPKVDSMTVFRGNRAREDRLFDVSATYAANPTDLALQPNATNNLMTLVVYQGGMNEIRSPARIIRSLDSAETGAVGVVHSLTLIARMEKGKLSYLQWHDMGCGECGGKDSPQCFAVGDGQRACGANADLLLECLDPLQETGKCQLNLYIAFAGTDKYSRPLNSGRKVESLDDFSITAAFADS
uniref:Uncharacterized protein n=1 Tax=Pyramimonas obovata TaxID=1411642 RepID=A0A7S0WKN8_9CHLO|mmetsp:Transcript_28571/g.62565  ORF Transcript_28571/g.62565 Transcript_28571/m.62565 type:complete len:259 (+) Transcript_28571:103-879(+)